MDAIFNLGTPVSTATTCLLPLWVIGEKKVTPTNFSLIPTDWVCLALQQDNTQLPFIESVRSPNPHTDQCFLVLNRYHGHPSLALHNAPRTRLNLPAMPHVPPKSRQNIIELQCQTLRISDISHKTVSHQTRQPQKLSAIPPAPAFSRIPMPISPLMPLRITRFAPSWKKC